MKANVCKKNNQGSSTIETALIISAILLILGALVYSFLIMYQKTLLTKAAGYVAGQGAVIWTDSRKSIYDGSTTGREEGLSMWELYYQLLDDSLLTGKKVREKIDISSVPTDVNKPDNMGLQDMKFLKMKEAIYHELSKGLLKPSSTYLEIDFSNIFVQRKISIIITQEVKIPLGGIKKMLSGKESITLKGAGTAVVTEPEEYIRNVDFMAEYITRSGVISNLGEKISSLKDKLEGSSKWR